MGEEPLRQLVLLLGQYKASHQGRNPANVAEFKQFVKNFDRAKLELWGIKDTEKIFISPRDNKPYVLRLHISGAPPSDGTKMPIVAHEQEGVQGKRMVAFLTMEVQEVEEAEFQELLKLK